MRTLRRLGRRPDAAPPSILDAYVQTAPSAQNAIDIFAGEWSSRFPEPLQELRAGAVPLFEDERIAWALEHLGDVSGRTVLELGPLEGGHTWQLARAGARVTAIEAHTRAYLKCLIAKELLGISGATFLLGDFIEYLRASTAQVDLCVASGVLYHLREPVELIELLAGAARRLMLWTHVYDADVIDARPELTGRFSAHEHVTRAGFDHTLHRFDYATALGSPAFCGGSADHANWLSRSDLLGALDHFGWRVDTIAFDQPQHPHGPALALLATNLRESDRMT